MEKMGEVLEVRIETRGTTIVKLGKARALVDLSKPLLFGTIINLAGRS